MRAFFILFPLALLISACSTTSPNQNSNDTALKNVEISSISINDSPTKGAGITSPTISTHEFKFPLTVSCLLQNKADPNITVVGVLIVEENRATMSGTNLFNYIKISNGVYKLNH